MSAAPGLVVFDVAGTTVRDRGEVPAAFRAALAAHGLAVDDDTLRGLRGASKRHAVQALVPAGPERAERSGTIYAEFRRRLVDRYRQDGVAAIDGAAELFVALRARGIAVALTTGFDADVTALLLEALGWDGHLVDVVVTGDRVPRGRPAPDLIHAAMEASGVTRCERVAAVGDTVRDLEAGHRAGVRWNVGVLSGAHDRATLAQAPHTHLLASVAELPRLFPGAA